MRYSESILAKCTQLFCAAIAPNPVSTFLKRVGVAFAVATISTFYGTPSADAQIQLQRLYTAPSGSPPVFLVQGHDGNFYGTEVNQLSGYIFKMTSSGTVTVLSTMYGLNPELALGDEGNIYGTVHAQPFGGYTNGLIFKITLAGQVTNVYSFDGTNGAHPVGMRKGIDGAFYGIMAATNRPLYLYPASNHFTIFQFTTNNTLTKLYSVTNGPEFTGIPIEDSDGNLYGTTVLNSGEIVPPFGSPLRVSIYRLARNGDFQNIFTRTNATATAGDLIFGPDNNLYGTLGRDTRGFAPNLAYGSVFRVGTNGVFSNLFSFASTNGSDPQSRLLFANDGYLYGTTFAGGVSNRGTIFRLSVDGEFTSLTDFRGTNGADPSAPLIQANDGNLYGTTESSAVSGFGTIFRLVQPISTSYFVLSNGVAALTWNSFSNGIYRVEYKNALSSPTWTSLIQRVTAIDQSITVFDNFASEPQRFYQVVLLP